jgi:cob(I)alamin adenosyltransferase
MHYKKDPRIWIYGTDEPVAHCDVAENEMGERKESAEQCLFLVQHDTRIEWDVFTVCAVLDHAKGSWIEVGTREQRNAVEIGHMYIDGKAWY